MSYAESPNPSRRQDAFVAAGNHSLPRELFDLLRYNKKWWLMPIVAVLVVLGVLIALGGSAAAPFIYTIF
jgi:hypothetical protein